MAKTTALAGRVLSGVAVVAMLASHSVVEASKPVYWCPGPPIFYTENLTPEEAAAKKCRVIEADPEPAPVAPTPRRAAPKETAPVTPPSPSRSTPRRSSGSAFLVSTEGHLVTNAHVVDRCSALTASRPGTPPQPAVVKYSDPKTDIAIVETKRDPSSPFAFRLSSLQSGEAVVALGYPLRGLLANEVGVSTGTVSALGGLKDDRSLVQIQAPIQPGNSGGPLLDMTGAVVGVVVAQLDALGVARAIGTIPQNVNFAIKAEHALAAMKRTGIEPLLASDGGSPRTAVSIAATSKPKVFVLECTRSGK